MSIFKNQTYISPTCRKSQFVSDLQHVSGFLEKIKEEKQNVCRMYKNNI
jgi:hypothetical protein